MVKIILESGNCLFLVHRKQSIFGNKLFNSNPMKKKITLTLLTGIVAISAMSFDIYDNDGLKTNKTGGHGETGCTCHSAGTANLTVAVTATPDISLGYVAGQTYTIHFTVAETGKLVFGLDFQALNSTNANAGTLTAGTGTQKITNTGLDNITHILDGGFTTDSHTFDFTWFAPASGTGNVTFWYSAVAGNHNAAASGDERFAGSTILSDVTAITENSISNFNFSVSPNPSSDNVNVKFSLKETSSVMIDLTDVNGNKVANFISDKGMNGDINKTFDISSYSKGIYFIRLNVNGQSSMSRIVKL